MDFINKNYNKIMCILCYISFLVLIPFFKEKNNKKILFHIKEGLNLFIIELIVFYILDKLSINKGIFSLFFIILSFIGIKNVLDNKDEKLPFIDKFKLIK